jgi:two-component system, chemotaxis family, CheB/CheR fusion protein
LRVPARPPETNWNYVEAQKDFDRRLLAQYVPATVIINEDLDVIHTRGDVHRYLKLASGRASLNILKMAREGLLIDLRNALTRAKKEGAPVRKHSVAIKAGNGDGAGDPTPVDFEVVPVTVGSLKETYFMVVFQQATALPKAGRLRRGRPTKASPPLVRHAVKLEQELAATKEYLQSVIETQEATNEELQSANEEILSSNEELQSTNEELETAKEELQSTNEELSTVNDELRSRNEEITLVNSDLTNLVARIGVSVILVGPDLTIRRFTPQAQQIFGLIPTDLGRPLHNINPAIEIPGFPQMVTDVITAARLTEQEIADRGGARYLLRVLPYQTADEKVDGAVILVVSIPARKAAET